MADQDQLSPAYGSQFVAQFVATFPTAPQSLEMLEKRMGDVKDALDEIRHVAELVTNATSDLQKSQHLAFRSELLRKGAKVSPALLTNHRHWVYFQNGLDDAFYWYYEHEKHLALMIDGLRDQRAIIRLFWETHAGVTFGTHSRARLGVQAEIITKQAKRLHVISDVIEYCRRRAALLWYMPKWLYWTEIEVPEEMKEMDDTAWTRRMEEEDT